jgi:hypothetical protein
VCGVGVCVSGCVCGVCMCVGVCMWCVWVCVCVCVRERDSWQICTGSYSVILCYMQLYFVALSVQHSDGTVHPRTGCDVPEGK